MLTEAEALTMVRVRRQLRVVMALAIAVVAAVFPGAAWAGTASLESRQTASGAGVSVLVFRPDPGERNELEARPDAGAIRASDSFPLTAGPGCNATSDPNTVRCPLAEYALLLGADIELGDGVDTAELDRGLSEGTVVRGGTSADDIHASGLLLGERGDDILSSFSGADTLRGGTGDDQLFAGPGRDSLEPGSGRDIVQSGAGDDRVSARDGAFDRISCGGGRDTVVMDRLDFPGDSCLGSRLRRRGTPRALPLTAVLGLDNRLRLEVGCPADFPRACRGTVVARLGRALAGRSRFRLRRGFRGNRPVRPSRRQLRKIRRATRFGQYTGSFRVTVRTRVRRGRVRTVSAGVPLSVDTAGTRGG
jgi:hypothetical protein